jgi:hypothetical protein
MNPMGEKQYDPATLAALKRFIAEERPDLTGKEAVRVLVKEQLIHMGLLALPIQNRGRAAGNRVPTGKASAEIWGPHPRGDWKPEVRKRR